jgi:hypothetical protein
VRIPSPIANLLCKAAAIIVEDSYESERSKFPDCRIGGLHVYGSSPFVSDVTEALAQLSALFAKPAVGEMAGQKNRLERSKEWS